jgi:kynurenine 3-monooxygenase
LEFESRVTSVDVAAGVLH